LISAFLGFFLFFHFHGSQALAQQAAPGAGQHLTADLHLIAGPQLTGDEYIALRGGKRIPVQQFDFSSDDPVFGLPRSVLIGPDFAIENSPEKTTVYDLRFRRFVEKSAAESNFSNVSLFGEWRIRWAFLQNNLWTSGMLAILTDATKATMDRYWIEQQNGIASPEELASRSLPKPAVTVKRDGSASTFVVGKTTVAEANSSPAEFLSAQHARTFAAWLAWSPRVHPSVATLIAEDKTAPSSVFVMKREFGPPDAEPVRYTLTFANHRSSEADFGAFAGLEPKTPSWAPYFSESLGALMVDAARGEAPNGPLSDAEYSRLFAKTKDVGTPLDVALIAFHAIIPCDAEAPPAKVCTAGLDALREVIHDEDVVKYTDALAKDQRGEYAAAAKDFLKLKGMKLMRPDILDLTIANTIVEGKNAKQLDADLSARFDALPSTFESIFIADPYAPSTYRDFYNYLYATAQTTEETYFVNKMAYPVIDIARSIPERWTPTIVNDISRLEERIATDFNVLFPSYAQAAPGE